MASYRREYVAPTSDDDGPVADREVHQDYQTGLVVFTSRLNTHHLRESLESNTYTVIDGNDRDPSGDYDPRSETFRNHPFYGALTIRPASTRRPSSPKPRHSTLSHGRRSGSSLISRLKLNSAAGKALLRSIGVQNHSNWPLTINQLAPEPNFTEISLNNTQASRLRERKTLVKYVSETKHDGLEEVTRGHPAARGCIQCFQVGGECSLLQEGSRYPCKACRENGNEPCRLISEPKLKADCLECKKARMVCSYRKSDENHDVPCERCQRQNKECLAGPKSGRMREGPTYPAYGEEVVEDPIPMETTRRGGASAFTKQSASAKKRVKVVSKDSVIGGGIGKSSARKQINGDTSCRGPLNVPTSVGQIQHGEIGASTMNWTPTNAQGFEVANPTLGPPTHRDEFGGSTNVWSPTNAQELEVAKHTLGLLTHGDELGGSTDGGRLMNAEGLVVADSTSRLLTQKIVACYSQPIIYNHKPTDEDVAASVLRTAFPSSGTENRTLKFTMNLLEAWKARLLPDCQVRL